MKNLSVLLMLAIITMTIKISMGRNLLEEIAAAEEKGTINSIISYNNQFNYDYQYILIINIVSII